MLGLGLKLGLGGAGFSPLSIPDVALWLDAADTSTIIESGGAVSQWNDKSGGGHNVTQGTGTLQPLTSGSINGKNALVFDGVDDRMDIPNAAIPNAAFVFTMFAVFVPNTTTEDFIFGNQGSGGNRTRKYFKNQEIDFGNNVLAKAIPTSGGSVLQAGWVDGTGVTTQYLKIGADSVLSSSVDNNYLGVNWYPFRIGADGYGSDFNTLDGSLGEFILYTRKLTDNEINLIGNSLSSKWGAAWSDV